jgi:hypothetical protein
MGYWTVIDLKTFFQALVLQVLKYLGSQNNERVQIINEI